MKIEVESSEISDHTARRSWTQPEVSLAATGKHPALMVSWHDGIKDGKPNKPEPPSHEQRPRQEGVREGQQRHDVHRHRRRGL